MISISKALQLAQKKLTSVSPCAHTEATLLVAELIGQSRAYLYAHGDRHLDKEQQATLQHWLERRVKDEPLAYILGFQDFWKMRLTVNTNTLIPRAATEYLVERLLQRLPSATSLKVHDLGTGSGAIAIALAYERQHWQISASDINQDALMIAQANADQHHCSQITWYHSDWFQSLPSFKADLIISNPPYVAHASPVLAPSVFAHEPHQALFARSDGLDAIRHIINNATASLAANGILALEHGFDQQASVITLLTNQGFELIEAGKDLDNHPRFVIARLNANQV